VIEAAKGTWICTVIVIVVVVEVIKAIVIITAALVHLNYRKVVNMDWVQSKVRTTIVIVSAAAIEYQRKGRVVVEGMKLLVAWNDKE